MSDFETQGDVVDLRKQLADVRDAWKIVNGVLTELVDLNDQDYVPGNVMKMSKLLLALSGELPRYRDDIDWARSVLSGLSQGERHLTKAESESYRRFLNEISEYVGPGWEVTDEHS